MSPARFSPHIQTEGQGAVVLIAGDTDFIGYYLSQFFLQQGCRVIFWQDFSNREVERIDYIFCLAERRKEKIEALLKISEKFGAKFLLALFKGEPLSFDLQKIFQQKEIDGRVVELDYVYGPRMDFDRYQETVQLIKVVKIKPVFVADVVYGLVKAMFVSDTTGKIFSLNEEVFFGWQPKVDLTEGLEQTETWFKRTERSKERDIQLIGNWKLEKKAEKGKRRKGFFGPFRFSPKVSIFIFFVLLIIGLGYPFYSLAFDLFWGVWNLKKVAVVASSDFAKTAKYAEEAESAFGRAKPKLFFLGHLAAYFNQGFLMSRIEKNVSLGEKTAMGIVCLSEAGKKASLLEEGVFRGEKVNIESLVGEIGQNLDCAYQQLSFAESLINSGLEKVANFDVSQEVNQLAEKLPETRELIAQGKKGIRLIPGLVGLYGRRTYLVLLQNNMELRPTGGFIGAYALLTFDQGRLIDFDVENVYNADGQLKGHIEPPPLLKEYLGEAGWYLRDSNWHPDYPTSAKRAAWFLEKETGRQVDGVLGINLFLAQKLLKAVGEVGVVDYQEKINADNLFERAEYHAEANFFPGSTQKQDFLGSLAKSLFEEIKGADQKTWFALGQAFYQSIKEKDLLIYLADREAMQLVADLDWDGRIKEIGCQDNKSCLVDYLMVVESNVGVNKVNYFVKRRLFHQAEIDSEGGVKKTVKLNYRNTSQSEAFPGGRYKNYLRLYVPLESELEAARIKDSKTNRIIKEIEKERCDVGQEAGKTFFGFLIEVPIQKDWLVEVVYRLKRRLTDHRGQYILLQQKQSGIRDEEFGFWFIVPGKIKIVAVNPETTLTERTAVFTPQFDRDLIFDIKITR